jgi:hypothetical protein
VEVSISVAGQDLTEYRDKHEKLDGSTTVMSYIQCVSDSEFAIKLKVLPSLQLNCPLLAFKVYIDGQYITGKACRLHKLVDHSWNRTILDAASASPTVLTY